ncbi:MAG: pantoate--beta-alanine ligase [Planctomycetota bacterium]
MAVVVKDIAGMREIVLSARAELASVGFVPTMGALHEGHMSLVRAAKKENDVCVVSVFVNPIQFGPGEDYERYPRAFDQDKELLERNGADTIFKASVEEMYPGGFGTYVVQDRLPDLLCGKSRPGHFRGVMTVCAKLFNIVKPDRAYFGQKDFQQTVVIRRMVRDLGFGIDVRVLPTVRDADGLALSSRNAYLAPDERQRALAIHRALVGARDAFARGERDRDAIVRGMRAALAAPGGVEVDYTEVVDADTLEAANPVSGESVAVIAARVGQTRLIDNACLA